VESARKFHALEAFFENLKKISKNAKKGLHFEKRCDIIGVL